MEPIPKVGDKHNFFDDGKLRESRHYIAEVLEVITPEEAKNVHIIRNECDGHGLIYPVTLTLHQIWREEVDGHRNSKNFKVLGKGVENKPGSPWCYAEETDYFVKCSIPEYDKNDVWFVRHVDGGWFSMDTQSSWMSGRLTPADFDWDEYQAEVARELSEWLEKHKNIIKNDSRRKNVVD